MLGYMPVSSQDAEPGPRVQRRVIWGAGAAWGSPPASTARLSGVPSVEVPSMEVPSMEVLALRAILAPLAIGSHYSTHYSYYS